MFKLIVWIIFFYLLFKVIRNFLGPFLNQGGQTQAPYNHQQGGYRPKEGSTTIHKTNTSGKRNDADDEGEYIDYKEIKE